MLKRSNQRIADLESELAEVREFNKRYREEVQRYQEVFAAILAEHQPQTIPSRDRVTVELRCCRCRTDEHHTWATDNYLPWPCPTIAPFIAYATYKPREAPAPSSEPPSAHGTTIPEDGE